MSLLSEFACPDCKFVWGPVGVQPYVPTATHHQLFLVCKACKRPATITDLPGAPNFTCHGCGGGDCEELKACPECDGARAAWRPRL